MCYTTRKIASEERLLYYMTKSIILENDFSTRRARYGNYQSEPRKVYQHKYRRYFFPIIKTLMRVYRKSFQRHNVDSY